MADGNKGSLLAGFATFLQRIRGGGGGGEDCRSIANIQTTKPTSSCTDGDMVEAAYKAFAADEKEVYYDDGGGGYLYLATTNLYATIDAAALADVPVRAVTFGAPRVGDALIKDRHVDVVSLVVKQDHRYVQVTEKVVELVVDDDVVGICCRLPAPVQAPVRRGASLHGPHGAHAGGEVAPERKNKWPEMEEEADGYKRLPRCPSWTSMSVITKA
uniref:Uncharacterized protein n=1 Tax=Oryza meridionalis TaxID=40149 RepID=A0A0E0D3H8_9ORYZ